MSFFSPTVSKKASKSGKSGSGSGSRSNVSQESKSSSKHSSKSSTIGKDNDGWNEWEWDPVWQREWRSREMPNGKWEYDYRYPDDLTPRSSAFEDVDNLGSIGEEEPHNDQFTTARPVTVSAQLPTSPNLGTFHSPHGLQQDRSKRYGAGIPENDGSFQLQGSNPRQDVDEDDEYYDDDDGDDDEDDDDDDDDDDDAPVMPAQRLDTLQTSASPHHGADTNYRAGGLTMMNSASIPILGSSLQLGMQEEEDIYDDDTISASAQKLESIHISQGRRQDQTSGYGAGITVTSNTASIPIPTRTMQQSGEEGGDYYNDDTVASPGSKSFMYNTSGSKEKIPFLPSSYSQASLPNTAYPPYGSPNAEGTVITKSPTSEGPHTVDTTRITGRATVAEDLISLAPQQVALYGNFKVHLAKEFELYRVFKILWTEPKGQGMASKRTEYVPTIYNEQCYTSIRRFVICSPRAGHCLCLPILTYNRQGTAKSGAKPQDHAIIYTERKAGKGEKPERPKETKDEEKLLKRPIRMEPKTQRDQLHPLSRLNYAKIYTVEYNVKVCFIGKIHHDSRKYFNRDYNLTNQPLPQEEHSEYSDDNYGLSQLAERDSEPQSQQDRRDTEPLNRRRGGSGKNKPPRDPRRSGK